MLKRCSLHSWTLVASSGKLNMDRRKWHFPKNHFFHEDIWKRSCHHTSFSLRKTGQPSPSISGLSQALHNSSSNLFVWAVRGTLVPHSFSWSYLELGLANYTQCIFLTPRNTHMWYSHNTSLMSVQLPVALGIVQTASWCLSSSLLEGFFILIAEHGEK